MLITVIIVYAYDNSCKDYLKQFLRIYVCSQWIKNCQKDL